jgi:cytochrome d ubiquinol oxidase subunit II
MIVLWLLILRGLGIEFRHPINYLMWKSFWDVVFSVSSLLLTVFFGATLGNIIRGVPLNSEGYFFAPLWTTFTIVPEAGILDWFTVLMGLVAFFTLTTHGANYLAMKTEGELQLRSRKIAMKSWWGVSVASALSLIAVTSIRSEILKNFADHTWGLFFPLVGFLGLVGMLYYGVRKEDAKAFLSSTAFIIGMLSSTAFGLYPIVLPASTAPQNNLTIYNTAANTYGLSVGLVWWFIGIVLASGYFAYIYRVFRGKVTSATGDSGY